MWDEFTAGLPECIQTLLDNILFHLEDVFTNIWNILVMLHVNQKDISFISQYEFWVGSVGNTQCVVYTKRD